MSAPHPFALPGAPFTGYRGGELYLEDCAVADLAARHGTPLYVYSRAAMRAALAPYQRAQAGRDHLVCYAMKANSSLAVLQTFAALGCGFDIVSGGELERVIAAGGDPAKVVFSGLGKTRAEMRRALEAAVKCFNVESEAELDALSAVALGLGKRAPVSLPSLQQKRSFLEGKLGQAMGSPLLDVADDPLIPKAFGSRLFDSEGLAAKRRPVFEKGVLRGYYIDPYYGKKLKMAPTSGGVSNLAWTLGPKPQAAILKDVGEGILVTGFLGGNSNGTTGDYSFGVQGFRIRGGERQEPVSEMNIAGNMLDLMARLKAVGNDPFPFSSMRTPTLVFEGVQVAGV